MTSEHDYLSQIQQYENFSHRYPRLYILRVILSALLAYFFIFFVILITLLLIKFVISSGRLIALKLLFPFLLLLYGLIRSLWIKFTPPQGITLNPEANPLLFLTLDHIRLTLNTPKIHQVLLTDDFNAAIIQLPRLGMLGWYKNYLLLGLPLMQALTPDQFKAVLAHELGHVSRAHGRIGSWIYRISQTWLQISDYFEAHQHWSNFIIRRFFQWFYPRFHAYSFILMREHEYEADQAAALVEGSRCIADALINISLKGAYLTQEFWPSLYRQANDTPKPPGPYIEMGNRLRTGGELPQANHWLLEAMTEESDYTEIHPSLKDRLAALKEEARIPAANHQRAAEYFLGERAQELLKAFDLKWLKANLDSWEEHFKTRQENKIRFNELRNKLSSGEKFDAQNLMELAWFTEEFESPELALPYYQATLREDPDFAAASYHLGRVLLEKKGCEADALHYLNTAMEADYDFIIPGNHLLIQYFIGQDRPEEAEKYLSKALDFARILKLAKEERQVRLDHNYIWHGLSSEQLLEIVQQLRQYPELSQAYLVRRKVQYLLNRPMYVLVIVQTHSGRSREKTSLTDRIASQVSFPGEAFVVELNWKNRKLKSVRKIQGALIYRSGF